MRIAQLCLLMWDIIHWYIQSDINITVTYICLTHQQYDSLCTLQGYILTNRMDTPTSRSQTNLQTHRLFSHRSVCISRQVDYWYSGCRPLILLLRPYILFQPGLRFIYPTPMNLHLTCWALSNAPSKQLAFQKMLPLLQHKAIELSPGGSTTAAFEITTSGASGNLLIQLIHL